MNQPSTQSDATAEPVAPIQNKEAFFASTQLVTKPQQLRRADGSEVSVLVGELSVEAATTLQGVSLGLLYLDEAQMYEAALANWIAHDSRVNPVKAGPEVVVPGAQTAAPVVDEEDAVLVIGNSSQPDETIEASVDNTAPQPPEKPALSERVWQLAEIYWNNCESVDSAVVVLGVMLITRNGDSSPMFANVADVNDIKRIRTMCSDVSLKAFYDQHVKQKQNARAQVREQEKN